MRLFLKTWEDEGIYRHRVYMNFYVFKNTDPSDIATLGFGGPRDNSWNHHSRFAVIHQIVASHQLAQLQQVVQQLQFHLEFKFNHI